MRSEESLSRFEYHLIVYFKELVDEQPSPVGAQLGAIAIFEYPVALFKLNAALNARKRVIVEFDVTICHSADSNLPRALRECKYLICLGAVQKLQLNLMISLVSSSLVLEKLNHHVRVTERNDVAMLEYQGNVKPHEGARTIAEISQVVVFVIKVVFNHHVSLPDARVHV